MACLGAAFERFQAQEGGAWKIGDPTMKEVLTSLVYLSGKILPDDPVVRLTCVITLIGTTALMAWIVKQNRG